MLDRKSTVVIERPELPEVVPRIRSRWLTGLITLAVLGLFSAAVVLIVTGEADEAGVIAHQPQTPRVGFFEGLDPGPLPQAVPAVTAAAVEREYERIADRGGFLEGLDGPVIAIEPAGSYQYRPLRPGSGFLEGLDPGPVPQTRQYERIADRSGFLEGLDGPVTGGGG